MIPVLNIARLSCHGSALRVLCNRSFSFGKIPCPVLQKTNVNTIYKCSALLSTSQNALASHTDHNHTPVWTAEKLLSAGLIALLPASLAVPNPVLDYALALALTAHVHWGIEAVVVDYVRPNVVGAMVSRAAVAVVYALSVFTLGGLFYFNYTDVGLSQAIRMLWKL